MNYELALKLKKAGFPQNIKRGDLFPYASDDTREKVYMPTLSELIEACGNDFRWLKARGDSWLAQGRLHPVGKREPRCYGSTPEEAVANLWLELNNKQ